MLFCTKYRNAGNSIFADDGQYNASTASRHVTSRVARAADRTSFIASAQRTATDGAYSPERDAPIVLVHRMRTQRDESMEVKTRTAVQTVARILPTPHD